MSESWNNEYADAFKKLSNGLEEFEKEVEVNEESSIEEHQDDVVVKDPDDEPEISNADEPVEEEIIVAPKVDEELIIEKEKNRAQAEKLSVVNKKVQELEEQLLNLNKKKEVHVEEETVTVGKHDEFWKDFPDFINPINDLISSRLTKELSKINSEINSLKTSLDSFKKDLQIKAKETADDKILRAHPDIRSIIESGRLANWIESKPSWIRPGYIATLQNAEDYNSIIELIDLFKQETGIKKSSIAEQKTNSAKINKDINKVLAVPMREPKVVIPSEDPDDSDYAGSFKEFASK